MTRSNDEKRAGLRDLWTPTLAHQKAIADWVGDLTPGSLNQRHAAMRAVFEQVEGCTAPLTFVPISHLLPNLKEMKSPEDETPRSLDVMPPILVEGDEVIDGHKRLREAINQGASHILAYTVRRASVIPNEAHDVEGAHKDDCT